MIPSQDKTVQFVECLFFYNFFCSKFDIHAMNYCVAVNMQRNLNSLCEAVDLIIGQTPKLFCSQLKGINNFFIRTADNIMNLGEYRSVIYMICS